MESNALISKGKPYIEEKILQLKKKFEMFFSAARDPQKKASYQKTLTQIDQDLKKLKADAFEVTDLSRYEITEKDLENYFESLSQPHAGEGKILRNILPQKLCPQSTNDEINAIWTYLNYFGKEYLGLLSEQNMRMDYGHSLQRDQFFTLYNQNIRILEDYGNTLQEIQKAGSNKDYKERLIKMQIKDYRDIIIKTGRFLHSIQDFIQEVLASETGRLKLLLDPDRIVEIHGVSNLNGLTTRQAVKDLSDFISEFVDFLKIPDLKKIEEEEDKLI